MDNLEKQARLETHHREKTNKTKSTTQKIARTRQVSSISAIFIAKTNLQTINLIRKDNVSGMGIKAKV
jgi:hypothetical protein